MAHWTVADIPSQAGRLAVITGANSGIGWHTALELARAGAEVVLATRSEAKGRDAAERIRHELPEVQVRAEQLDLADLSSLRAFAARLASAPKIDLLVNNAGVMSVPTRQLTKDGFELQFGTKLPRSLRPDRAAHAGAVEGRGASCHHAVQRSREHGSKAARIRGSARREEVRTVESVLPIEASGSHLRDGACSSERGRRQRSREQRCSPGLCPHESAAEWARTAEQDLD
jgi:NAD(P)-dependent dehydrogenase (short-subunit alcohol dehydrogenase family)